MLFGNEINRLFHALGGGRYGVYLYFSRAVQDVAGQFHDDGGHSGRKEERLPLFRQFSDHPFDIVYKAHIEHAVGLIEYEELDLAELDVALVHEVEQAARGGHQDIYTRLQLSRLGMLRHTSENDGMAQLQMLAVGVKAFSDLYSQLPRRGQDQRLDGPLPAVGPAQFVQELEDRQRKGCRLAGARLGAGQQVSALEGQRNGLCLNGCWFLVSSRF